MTLSTDLSRLDAASAVRPHPRQIRWQQLEFYAFVHFGMNTMTDREWGLGNEDPALFDPTDVDVEQWVSTFRDAGMRAVILTCKHHDGFALWPSAVTSHSVASSPWHDGEGDLVAEVAQACERHGLAFGVYLSPWDRTEPSYGSGAAYDDFFVAQLEELLTDYGPLFCVWFDGANGEGPNGRTQVYDWDRYFALIRRLQPDAVISVCGPDVRWCGNEAGHTRPDEWSVVPASLRDAERTAEVSQHQDDGAFAARIPSDVEDLGSRQAVLAGSEELVWYPAEVNTSIRPGWFHHPAEDDQVRSVQELFDIHLGSVGGNATFLLNVPPDRSGRLSPGDVAVLEGLGARIAALESADVAVAGEWHFSSDPVDPRALTGPTPIAGGWSPDPSAGEPRVTISWPGAQDVSAVVLREDIARGQQIDAVSITAAFADARPDQVVEIASVGHQRIVLLDWDGVSTLSIAVPSCRGQLALAGVRVLGPTAWR